MKWKYEYARKHIYNIIIVRKDMDKHITVKLQECPVG